MSAKSHFTKFSFCGKFSGVEMALKHITKAHLDRRLVKTGIKLTLLSQESTWNAGKREP